MTRRLSTTIPTLAVLRNLPVTRARDRMTPDRLAAVQSRLLRRLVRHAYANMPYYRGTLPADAVARLTTAADLASLPVLDRRTVNQIGPDQLLADGFTLENTRIARTSGSSGIPITLYYSERDLGYLRASYLWDLLASGLRPFDRIGFFRVGGFRRHRLERFGIARNVHINTGLTLDEQVAAFLAGRPTFLCGFPTTIAILAQELQRRGIRYRGVSTVVLGGESLAQAARAELREYFGAREHEVYAAVEVYTVARTCPRGAMHLRSGDVVVEVERADGSVVAADRVDGEEVTGEILVTRLHAEAMPLLRYRLGDRVRITPDDCPCRVAHTPIVRGLLGRVEDELQTRNGQRRNCEHLMNLLQRVPGIRQWQLRQHEPGSVEVLVVPTGGAPADLVAQTERILVPAADSFTTTVRLADRITPEPSGKVKLVKQLPPDGR